MPSTEVLETGVTRDFSITLKPIAGGITLFYAFINGIKVIQHDGSKERKWEGKIPDMQVRIKVRVVGIGNAKYKLSIDLPGTANDQSLNLQLEGGYHEIEILL